MTIQDSTSTIASSAKRFFSGTLLSRLSGLAREVAMAAAFGTDPIVAAFWMAFRFAHLLRRLFGEGALHAAFIPHYEALRKEDPVRAAHFFFDLVKGVACTLFFITLALEVVLALSLRLYPFSGGNCQVVRLTMLMLPALLFICLYALNGALLNCQQVYFWPSAAPAALNLVWIGAIFLVQRQPIVVAVESLAMLLVLAFAFQWGVTLPHVYHYLKTELGSAWKKQFAWGELMKILRPFALGITGVAATQINSACDALFARAADPAGPAYLWYALRLEQLPMALFGIGLMGACLPPITRALQRGERGDYLKFLNFALHKGSLLLIPTTLALITLGFSGINLVYGHGEFTQLATYKTGLCLWAYGLSLLPSVSVFIFAAACYGDKNYSIPTLFSLLTVFANLSLNALFVFVFHWGAVSVALSTTLSALFNALSLALYLRKALGLDLTGLPLLISKTSLAALFAAAATLLFGYSVFNDTTLPLLLDRAVLPFPRTFETQLLSCALQSLCFAATFLLATYALRLSLIEKKSFQTRA